jgi:hypothetical protein
MKSTILHEKLSEWGFEAFYFTGGFLQIKANSIKRKGLLLHHFCIICDYYIILYSAYSFVVTTTIQGIYYYSVIGSAVVHRRYFDNSPLSFFRSNSLVQSLDHKINFGPSQILFHRIIFERCQGLVLIFCLQSKQR